MEPLYKAVMHGCLAGKHQDALVQIWQNRIMRRDEHFAVDRLGAFGLNLAMFASFFKHPWVRLADGLSLAAQACVWSHAGYALRALGRLDEASTCMVAGMECDIELKNFSNVARAASNISALAQTCGALDNALEMARKCVKMADRAMEPFERLGNRTTLAAVLHSLGRQDEAAAVYAEADKLHISDLVSGALFNSIQGFRYCDLLLERGFSAAVRHGTAASLIYAREQHGPLDNAFTHLSAGRAYLIGSQDGTTCDADEASRHICQAVELFRTASDQEHVPLGLLARAELYIHTRDFANARRDLDEAMTIATRCGFRLHEADAHLGYARLAIAKSNRATAGEHLEEARKIVEATGYHRRDGELAALDAEIAQMTQPIDPPIVDSNLDHEPVVEGRTHVATVHDNERFDIAIICAVSTELEKIKDTGSAEWTARAHSADDPSTYYQTIYTTTKTKQELKVVASMATQMGMPAAAVLATKMIRRFQPRLLAMVGIAAGAKNNKQNYGDILAPSQTFDYNSGKILLKENKLCFEPDPNPRALSSRMLGRLQEWANNRRHLDSIGNKWSNSAQRTRLELHIGSMGSGAAVVDVPKPVMDVMEHWRKLIGIEMEAYAAHLACDQAIDPPCEFLCMKSISDFAGGNKDEWRDYAAYTSAQLCHRFLTEEWENLFPR